MIALVTGANGCIGSALLRELLDSGEYQEIRALVRRPEAERDLPNEVIPFHGSLDDADSLRRAGRGVDTVFHTAAKVHDADGAAADFQRDNVEGTRNLLDACVTKNLAPPRVVHFSTVAVYGDNTPAYGLSEDAPARPATAYARSKVEAEAFLTAWGREWNTPVVNLRVATVYGPRDRGNMARMIDAIVRGRYLTIGTGQNRKTCVAVRNVAHAARIAVHPNALRIIDDRPLVVADPVSYTVREMEQSIRRTAGIMGGGLTLPVPLALRLARCVEVAAKIRKRRSPLTVAQVRRLAADNVYQVGVLPQIPGYAPPMTTLDAGMAEAVAWYRQEATRCE